MQVMQEMQVIYMYASNEPVNHSIMFMKTVLEINDAICDFCSFGKFIYM